MEMSPIWFLIFFISIAEMASAADIPHQVISEKQLEDEFANEEYFGYDEGFEDDFEEDDQLADDGFLTKEELQELKGLNFSNKASLTGVIDGTTTVTLGNTYDINSHNEFSVLRYSNNYLRFFNLVRGPSVYCIEIHCWYFRIQRSYRCRKDRFIIYKPPSYANGKRYCGRRHGLTLKFFSDVRVVFKTNRRIRRPGFGCVVTPSAFPAPPPCCDVIPVEPNPRVVVTTCADLLPGYDFCSCTELSDGICLICTFCENCHLEFLAVHDFSQTRLYIYFDFPCNNCTMDLATNSYGYEQYVAGYVDCFNSNPIVTLPAYPSSDYVIAIPCPPPANFDICGYYQSLITGQGRRLPFRNGEEEGTKNLIMGTGSLAKSCGSKNLVILEDTFDFSLVNNPECFGTVTITGFPCSNFTQNAIIDLTAFINIQKISLNLCTPSLSCGSIIVNSPTIQEVSVSDTTSCNSSCLVTNQDTSPTPTIIGC